MATIDEILGMNSELEKLLKQRYELDMEKFEKIREVEKEFGELINSVCEMSSAVRGELYKYAPDFIKKSEFDSKMIGSYITDLISQIENDTYYYYVAQYNGRFHKEDQYGETLTTEQSSFHLIGKNPTVSYEEDCPVESRYSFLNDCIKLKKSVKTQLYQSYIKFYDYNQDDALEKTIDFKEFSYVYEFINKLIEYKLNNNTDEISKDEIDKIFDAVVSKYKKGKQKVLVQKKGVKDGKKDS